MPTNCQTEIRESVTRAELSSPSQGANQSPSPMPESTPSETPQSGLRINCQMNPTMTTDSMVGRKITVR